MRLAYTIRDTGVFFMSKDLQTLNGQNKRKEFIFSSERPKGRSSCHAVLAGGTYSAIPHFGA